MNWRTSYGTLFYSKETKALRLMVPYDLIKFYQSLIDKEYKVFTDCPAHGGHISIVLPKLHVANDAAIWRIIREYKNRPIAFKYDPDIKVGGYTKGFLNFWVDVKSEDLTYIAKQLNVDETQFHLTICNTKKGGSPYIWETPKSYKDLKPN